MNTFLNLTPHAIQLVSPEDGSILETVPPCDVVARVEVKRTVTSTIRDIPVYECKWGKVTGLPEPHDEVFYIVSMTVREACPTRIDVLSPGPLIRNEQGQVTGCTGLDRNPTRAW